MAEGLGVLFGVTGGEGREGRSKVKKGQVAEEGGFTLKSVLHVFEGLEKGRIADEGPRLKIPELHIATEKTAEAIIIQAVVLVLGLPPLDGAILEVGCLSASTPLSRGWRGPPAIYAPTSSARKVPSFPLWPPWRILWR